MPPKRRGKGRGRGVAPPHEITESQPGTSASAVTESAQGEVHSIVPTSIRTETGIDTLSKAMKRLGLELTYDDPSHFVYAKRPGIGTLGRKIPLKANYFPIELPHGEVFHYDVDIYTIRKERTDEGDRKKDVKKKDKCLNTRNKRKVVEAMLKAVDIFRNIRPAFDGEKNLYTRNKLPINNEKTFSVSLTDQDGRSDSYEIKIQPVTKKGTGSLVKNSISLEPLHQLLEGKCFLISEEIIMGIMAIETILRHGPALRLVPVGRSFFQKPRAEEVPPLSGGREIWFGHHQSMRISQWKPMLNIDMSATTFYKSGPVINYMLEILYPKEENKMNKLRQIKMLNDYERKIFAKELKGLRIQVTHLSYPRKYRVSDVTRESAHHTIFFREENGKKIKTSVAQYFEMEYKKLQYPNLPCLDVGTQHKKIYLPMEVCDIVEGQHCKKKLTEIQTSEMIKCTARPPAERFRDIQHSLTDCIKDFRPFEKEFGIRINSTPMQFEGRVLAPPHVLYNEQQKIKPSNGSWDMKGKQFYTGVNIDKWMLLSFSTARWCNEESLESFAKLLFTGGRNVGIKFARPVKIACFNPRTTIARNIIKEALDIEPKLQLAVIVLPTQGPQNIYTEIKNVAETELGLMTQCVKDSNTSGKKCNPQLICNLCQKINAKMGGVNNSLLPNEKPPVLKNPIIIIGADCTHPAPGDKVKPSIAAVVGSLDGFPSRYKASVRVQQAKTKDGKENETRQEIIIDLKDMVKELLKAFYKHTGGKKPEKIIFYRDGVSEGEFTKVLNDELKQVKQACLDLNEDYKPPITFIIVGKRHHTRFAPLDRRDGVGKHANIPPGTTVDTDIVHPIEFDFFMCSHTGIQGTSRPAHYTVLWDDNEFSADELQTLTYYLCHTYVRCTRSISIPCPVMYAHLAAYRAKQYLIAKTEEMSSSGSETSGQTEVIVQESIRQAVKVVQDMQNTMYFV
ncbi:protein argonaute-2-like [Centruroides vittatus]|uniref:protein argonaute-2-like n=1 Tax=Centruroides vittatus TaxID=120091 RepID=UPI00350F88E7